MVIELCRLTRDVELKQVDMNGEQRIVLNNSVAIKVGKDNTAFIDITVWGAMAETMAKYLKKGDELLIKGEIRNRKYKVGEKEITTVFILVKNFEFTYGNKRGEKQESEDEDYLP